MRFDSNHFYVSDVAARRIVLILKDGKFEKQYMDEDKNKWANMKDFVVSKDEKLMYILAGTKVLEVTL